MLQSGWVRQKRELTSAKAPGRAGRWLWMAAAIVVTLVVSVFLAPVPGGAPARAERPSGTAASEVFERGLEAYRLGHMHEAERLFERAAKAGNYLAQYHLARLYGGHSKAHADARKSFSWFMRLVRDNRDVDADDIRRATVVARALIALASYLREGDPEADIPRSPDLVVRYLSHAAYALRNVDAEYELAKEYVSRGPRTGLIGAHDWLIRHALSSLYTLARTRWHAPSMLLLGELHADGRFVERSPAKALALARLAVRHAGGEERIWVEEAYQRIYCSTDRSARSMSSDLVNAWYSRYGEPPKAQRDAQIDAGSLVFFDRSPVRQCASGEPVKMDENWLRRGETPAREAGRGAVVSAPRGPISERDGLLGVGATMLTPVPSKR